jgi:hypothetical protein
VRIVLREKRVPLLDTNVVKTLCEWNPAANNRFVLSAVLKIMSSL